MPVLVAATDINAGLTQERLKELFEYNPETGFFVCKTSRPGGAKPGDRAGYTKSDGYRCIKIDRRAYLEHRLAWLYMTGTWPEMLIDHIDTNKANNGWSNLRSASYLQNQHNRKAQKNVFSGLKGVYRRTDAKRSKPWHSCIRIDGVLKHLGSFTNPEEAHEAYKSAAVTYFGEFART